MSGDEGLRAFIDLEVPEPSGSAPEPDVRRLIALPAEEIADLRARGAAADRVRELADELTTRPYADDTRGVAALIYAALDGTDA